MLLVVSFMNGGNFGPTNKYTFGAISFVRRCVDKSFVNCRISIPASESAATIDSIPSNGEELIQVSNTLPERYELAANLKCGTPALQKISSISLANKYASGSLLWYSISKSICSAKGAIAETNVCDFSSAILRQAVSFSISAVRSCAFAARSFASAVSWSAIFPRASDVESPLCPQIVSTTTPSAITAVAIAVPQISIKDWPCGNFHANQISRASPTTTAIAPHTTIDRWRERLPSSLPFVSAFIQPFRARGKGKNPAIPAPYVIFQRHLTLLKLHHAVYAIHFDGVFCGEAPLQNQLGQWVFQLPLNGAFQRSCAVHRVKARVGDFF